LPVVGLLALFITLLMLYLSSLRGFFFFFFIFLLFFFQIVFFTLCERKLLALWQRRTGPTVFGTRGRLQIIVDSLKLLFKVFLGPRRVRAGLFQGVAMAVFGFSWFLIGSLCMGPGLDIAEVEYSFFFFIASSFGFSLA
jgi:NADH:ubiquinone oxidoreductase subunit H